MTSDLFRVAGFDLRRPAQSGPSYRLMLPQLAVSRGRITAIIGPSGSGKSTLLNALTGLDRPDKGSVTMRITDDDEPVEVSDDDFPHVKVGRVFQSGHLLGAATVAANLALAMKADNLAHPPAEKRPIERGYLAAALARVGLGEDLLDRRVWQLSGGQQQRVAVARAMISGANLLVADEPTSSLDPDLASTIMDYLRDWIEGDRKNRSIVWVTHNYDQVIEYAEEVLVLNIQRTNDGATLAAQVIEGETRPRSVPTTREELETWVGVGPDNGTTLDAERKHKPWRTITLGIAASLVFSRSSRPQSLDRLVRFVSAPSSDSRKRNSGDGLARAFIASFAEISLLSRLVVAALLFAVLAGGFLVQYSQYQSVLLSPRVCNLPIGANPYSDRDLSPEDLGILMPRPWRSERTDQPVQSTAAINSRQSVVDALAASPGGGCAEGVGAWPRMSRSLSIWVPEPDSIQCDESNRPDLVAAQTMIIHRNEPILGTYTLSGTSDTAANAFGDPVWAGLRLGAILSDVFVTHELGLGMTIEELTTVGQICVGIPGDSPRRVQIVGISNDLPQDSRFFYDILLPLEAYDRVFAPPTDAPFATTVLYFDPREVDSLFGYLQPTQSGNGSSDAIYRFNVDQLDQARSVINTTILTSWLFVVVGLLTVVAIALMLIASTTSFIKANAPALAMQLTLGLPARIPARFLLWHAVILWALSAVFVVAIWLPTSTLISRLEGVSLDVLGAYSVQWRLVVFSVLCTGFLTLVSVLFAFRYWLSANKNRLATILQSGG